MTAYLPHILSLLIGAAGWYYMFYSRAAQQLAPFESEAVNRRRVRYRRVGGGLMCVLAVLIFAGLVTIDPGRSPSAFVFTWAGVVVVTFAVLVLALKDVRMARDLRGKSKDDRR
jgi:drug/metabolite transporter (DMT)-like permease